MKTTAYITHEMIAHNAIELDAITNDFDFYAERIIEMLKHASRTSTAIEGGVLIESEGVRIDFVDELSPVISNLCLRSVPPLMRGETVTVLAFGDSGAVVLAPSDDRLSVYDLLDTVVVPDGKELAGESAAFTTSLEHAVRSLLEVGTTYGDIWAQLAERYPQLPGLRISAESAAKLRDEARAAIQAAYPGNDTISQ